MALHAKWAGTADGPYIHVDNIIEWMETEKQAWIARQKKESDGTLHVSIDEMCQVFRNWAGTQRKLRLDQVAATAPAALADLIDLRDELEQGLDP